MAVLPILVGGVRKLTASAGAGRPGGAADADAVASVEA